ncbi:MAG: replication factor C small subunit [Candidatus Aenigmatarchaeota archaeon]|nr:MAG: replication factor C small subunit [Candidatus Aenigmarchaeota archaeon]
MSSQVWTEKYRPEKLNEIINQSHVVERLRSWVKEGSVPNMLFAGPAGVGKTTAALCLAREIFGEHWRENFQETNASDQRGIDVVRGKIKNFAMTKPLGSDFKIIFLDESDSLTPEAQQALRRTMEKFSDVCRFILSCNYSSRIIEAIQSRCSVFRFKRLGSNDVEKYLKHIVSKESLKIKDDVYATIHDLSEGDLRKATNILQACSTLDKIDREGVYQIVSQVRPEDVDQMIRLALDGDFSGARKKLYDLLISKALSGEDILKAVHSHVFKTDLDEKKKLSLVEILGEYEFRLNQGATPEVQLEAMLAQFMKVGSQ